jgi:Family of unknown function (DUF6011)
MSIRHHDHRHETVDQVRTCEATMRTRATEQAGFFDPAAEDAEYDRAMQAQERAEDEAVAHYKAQRDAQYERQSERMADHLAPNASDKQREFVKSLASERNVAGLPAAAARTLAAVQRGLYASKREASALIDELKALPKDPALRPPNTTGLGALYDQVPDGRYAVEHGGQPVRFYRVATSEATGRRWMMVQASDDLHRIGYQQKVEALTQVLADGVQAAMERYGRELGHCGHCGRTLTNDESITRGIGPVCASRMGWAA